MGNYKKIVIKNSEALIEHAKVLLVVYPTLFNTVDDALHHIFVVLGSGYDWNTDGHIETHTSKDMENVCVTTVSKDFGLTRLPYRGIGIASRVPDNAEASLVREALRVMCVSFEKGYVDSFSRVERAKKTILEGFHIIEGDYK